jgi:hypothetical protein
LRLQEIYNSAGNEDVVVLLPCDETELFCDSATRLCNPDAFFVVSEDDPVVSHINKLLTNSVVYKLPKSSISPSASSSSSFYPASTLATSQSSSPLVSDLDSSPLFFDINRYRHPVIISI